MRRKASDPLPPPPPSEASAATKPPRAAIGRRLPESPGRTGAATPRRLARARESGRCARFRAAKAASAGGGGRGRGRRRERRSRRGVRRWGREGAQLAAPHGAPEVLGARSAHGRVPRRPPRARAQPGAGPAPCPARQFAPFSGACRGLARPPPPAAPARAAPRGLLLSLLAILRRVVRPWPPPQTPLSGTEQPNRRRSCLSRARRTLVAFEARAVPRGLGAPQTPRPSLPPPPRSRVPRTEALSSLSKLGTRLFNPRLPARPGS